MKIIYINFNISKHKQLYNKGGIKAMIKLFDGGAWLIHGTEVFRNKKKKGQRLWPVMLFLKKKERKGLLPILF